MAQDRLTWDDVLAIPGFSSAMTRAELNRAVAMVPRARILEIGSYMGSTTAALCFGNEPQCIHCVDNHSEFGNTRANLSAVCQQFGLPAALYDFDFFKPIPQDTFGGEVFNVYHYDGPHAEEQHAQELSIALPHLADSFVYIVDDFSWPQVRSGCKVGLLALSDSVHVVRHVVYESSKLNDAEGYWNGLLVAWCQKT